MSGFEDKVNGDKIRADIAATMPLEATEKPAGAFLEGESYPTSSEGVKSLYGLPIEKEIDIVDLLRNEGYEVVEGAEAVREAIRRPAMGERIYGKV